MPEAIEITNMKKNCEDREYVLKTVKENGKLLEFASENLKEDREIVYESVSKLGWTYCYARGKILEDRELLISG